MGRYLLLWAAGLQVCRTRAFETRRTEWEWTGRDFEHANKGCPDLCLQRSACEGRGNLYLRASPKDRGLEVPMGSKRGMSQTWAVCHPSTHACHP